MRPTKARKHLALVVTTILVFVGIPFAAYAMSWGELQQYLNGIEANQNNLTAQEKFKASQLLGTWQEKNIPAGSLAAQKELWEEKTPAEQADLIAKYTGTYGDPSLDARNQAKDKAVKEDPSGRDTGGRCGSWWKYITSPINCFFAPMVTALVGGIIMGIAGSLLSLSGYLFNVLVSTFIVAFGDTVKSLSIIDGIHTGWTILRDMSNILIIGMFTFIAISIIIGNHTFGQRKLVAKVLVVAVLINFSLLFAKIIIDSSNFIAWQVYKKMAPAENGTNANISGKFLTIANATTFVGAGADVFKATQNSIAAARDEYGFVGGVLGLDVLAGVLKGVFYSLLASVFMLFAAGVLLYGSFLILSRAVLLIVLMLVSALAFATYLIPSLSGGEYGWSSWWKSLINASVFGPLLMLLLYLSIVIVTPFAGQRGNGAIGNAINNPSAASAADWKVMFMFVISIGLLYASFRIANNFSQKIAGFPSMPNLLNPLAPIVATSRLGGLMGRSSIGRWSANKHSSLKKKTNKTFFDQWALRGLNTLKGSKFDALATKTGSKYLGKLHGPEIGTDWGKGGYVGVKKRQTDHAVHVAAENSEKPSAAADRAEGDARKKMMERIASELEKTRKEASESNRAMLETVRGSAADQRILAQEAQKRTDNTVQVQSRGGTKHATAEEINREAVAQHSRSQERQRVQGEMASRIGRAQAVATESAMKDTLLAEASHGELEQALELLKEGADRKQLPKRFREELDAVRAHAEHDAHHSEQAFAESIARWTPGILFGDTKAKEDVAGALKAHAKEDVWKDVVAGVKKQIEGGDHGAGGHAAHPSPTAAGPAAHPPTTTAHPPGDSHGHA